MTVKFANKVISDSTNQTGTEFLFNRDKLKGSSDAILR